MERDRGEKRLGRGGDCLRGGFLLPECSSCLGAKNDLSTSNFLANSREKFPEETEKK